MRLAVRRHDGHAVIEVDNNGPGVPPEFRDTVFERFARGPNRGGKADSGGRGLGLALVAQHVRGTAGACGSRTAPEAVLGSWWSCRR